MNHERFKGLVPILSKRLQVLADLVPRGAVVADIGTDHAQLPAYLVKTGRCPSAIAGELNPGPYGAALEYLNRENLQAKVDLRSGDGLNILSPGEVGCIVVAGMGGGTIAGILAARPDVLAPVERLVLQPMSDSDVLRLRLAKHGWKPIDERLVEEDGRIYEVIAAGQGGFPAGNRLELEIGPILIARRDPLLRKLLGQRLEAMERAYRELEHSKTPEGRRKREQIGVRMEEIRRVIACQSVVR
jgi:tRNA (adenine22-N1)-methyltransferase